MKYRSKPRSVSAIQFSGSKESADEVREFLAAHDCENTEATWDIALNDGRIILDLDTPLSTYRVEAGNWILVGEDGIVECVAAGTFAAQFSAEDAL